MPQIQVTMNKLFIFGKAVSGDTFTDREKETAKLVSNFKYGINTFIVSPRRWGKTSLVKKAKSQAESNSLKIVYLDIQKCKSRKDFCEKLASAVLSQTAGKLEEWMENAKNFLSHFTFNIDMSNDSMNQFSFSLGAAQPDDSLEDILQLPENIAKKKNCNIVICIDEFQQIANYDDALHFQAELRSVWQHHEKVSYCLFGSKKHLMESIFDDTSKPFYKFGDVIYLKKIPQEYWIKYITEKFASEGKTISEEFAARICETVDCHSSYVQQLSWYVFQGTEKEVTQTIFDDAVEELIDQCTEMFENKTDNLSYYQMNFLKALADGHTEGFSSATILKKYDLGSSANVTILKKALIDKDFIMIENSKVYFNDPVMKLWLKR